MNYHRTLKKSPPLPVNQYQPSSANIAFSSNSPKASDPRLIELHLPSMTHAYKHHFVTTKLPIELNWIKKLLMSVWNFSKPS